MTTERALLRRPWSDPYGAGRLHGSWVGAATGVVIVTLGLVAAACGASVASGAATATTDPVASPASPPATSTTAAAAATPVVVRAAVVPLLGTVLVDAAGRTLYLFGPDAQTGAACTDRCAAAWPPLVVAGPSATAGSGIEASLLGTVRASDGRTQVTYNHWPLYTFSGDAGPGQANGQGLDGRWFAVTVAGAPAPTAPPATTRPPEAAPATTTAASPATPVATTPPLPPPQVTVPVTTAQRVTPPPATAPPRTTTRASSPPTTAPVGGGAGF